MLLFERKGGYCEKNYILDLLNIMSSNIENVSIDEKLKKCGWKEVHQILKNVIKIM